MSPWHFGDEVGMFVSWIQGVTHSDYRMWQGMSLMMTSTVAWSQVSSQRLLPRSNISSSCASYLVLVV